jgi:hypothetical protein
MVYLFGYVILDEASMAKKRATAQRAEMIEHLEAARALPCGDRAGERGRQPRRPLGLIYDNASLNIS